MSVEFTAASSVTAAPVSAPMVNGVPECIWISDPITVGASMKAVSVHLSYESIVPDTADSANQPFNFEVALVIELEQDDGSWEEVGRTNSGFRAFNQGAFRNIIVSPGSSNAEEGVDQFITGLAGQPPALIKSRFQDAVEGKLRLCMMAVELDSTGNSFESVTFSVHGRRYDPV